MRTVRMIAHNLFASVTDGCADEAGNELRENVLLSRLKLCESGVAGGCLAAATVYENGVYTEKNMSKALEHYRLACAGGAPKGCEKAKEWE